LEKKRDAITYPLSNSFSSDPAGLLFLGTQGDSSYFFPFGSGFFGGKDLIYGLFFGFSCLLLLVRRWSSGSQLIQKERKFFNNATQP